MNDNNKKLFITGIFIGGVILFFVAAFQRQYVQPFSPTQAPQNLPRLIATEPLKFVVQATEQVVSPTAINKPLPTRNLGTPQPTRTPLLLVNSQLPDVIGYSVENRPLEVYKFGSGEHERMIVAGIHGGDEWNTVALTDQLIIYINQYPNTVPANVTLYILRNLNPDGEYRAHDKYGRLNSNGVDLNRNFPTNWQSDWNKDGCWNYLPTSSGSSPGSEPETQALMEFINDHHIEALISYHSAALGIFPGGEPWDEKSTQLAESIAQISTYPFPPIDTGCLYTGTLPDYAVSKDISALDVELSDHRYTDFDMNLNILEIVLNWLP